MGINPTKGHVVVGVKIDGHRFLGRVPAAQLFQIAGDPRRTEDLDELEGNPELESVRRVRLEVQRLFEGAKEKNVDPYAKYIVEVNQGADGMAPPIILFSEDALDFEDDEEGKGRLQVPWGAQLVAIDGETQLAARFEAAKMSGATRSEFVPVMVCHGRGIEWARQVFHDLNLLGVRPNAAIGLAMDDRDPLTHVARQVEEQVAFLRNRVNKVRRQLRKRDPEIMTITALRGACITFAEGIGGVKFGAKPVVVDPKRLPVITETATEWFGAVLDLLGAAMEDRKRSLAGAPPVLAAIGAVGHPLVECSSADDRTALMERLLDQLRLVRWDKGKPWEGIAGKFTPKGNFSVGGTKETAYQVYAALNDRTSPGYERVRVKSSAAA